MIDDKLFEEIKDTGIRLFGCFVVIVILFACWFLIWLLAKGILT